MNPEDFLQLVGQNIRTARHLAGLSIERAVEGRGAQRFLGECETGKRNPSTSALLAWAQKFGVTPADLVNVPGLRPGAVPLDEQEAEPPPRGRPRTKEKASKKKTTAKKTTAKKTTAKKTTAKKTTAKKTTAKKTMAKRRRSKRKHSLGHR